MSSEQPAGPVAGDTGTDEQNAVVADQIGEQAASVTGTDSAGIYGDVAGASQRSAPQTEAEVAEDLQARGGKATEVDTEALLKQLQDLAAQVAMLQNAGAVIIRDSTPVPPVLEEVHGALSGVSPGIVHAFELIAGRLAALEHHLFGSPEEASDEA
jgi:hypothetical protein